MPPVHTEQRDPHERRVHHRSPVSGVLVWSDKIKGRLLDVSDTGLSISTSCGLQPGEYVSFRVIGDRQSIVSGEVRWVQEDSVKIDADGRPTAIYHVGLALLHDPHWLPEAATGSSHN